MFCKVFGTISAFDGKFPQEHHSAQYFRKNERLKVGTFKAITIFYVTNIDEVGNSVTFCNNIEQAVYGFDLGYDGGSGD